MIVDLLQRGVKPGGIDTALVCTRLDAVQFTVHDQ